MLKLIEEQCQFEASDLDSVVRAYELANAGSQQANLDDFLPEQTHPQYSTILRELIRLEMEFSWTRGKPHRLAQFQRRFPEIFADQEALQEIAYEEYRLRLATGERPSVVEYQSHFEIDCSDWPSADERNHAESANGTKDSNIPSERDSSGSDLCLASSVPDVEMRNAALAYTVFRLNGEGTAADRSDEAWSESVLSATVAGKYFRELHESNPESACRLAMVTSAMPEVGSRFLDFELDSELGRGTFGRVFLARQMSLAGRLVALKITAEKSVESRALAQMQHTHIVPVYSVHKSGPFHAVVMPYFGSATLVDLLRLTKGQETQPQSGTALVSTVNAKHRDSTNKLHSSAATVATVRATGTVTESQIAGIMAPELQAIVVNADTAQSEILKSLGDMTYVQAILWVGARIADALAHAHERGILHRDLKPANILLTNQGPMLLDFNLAADTKGSVDASAAKLGGTLPYMAPEHLEAFRDPSKAVDGRCDVYSLGVVLYELLSGRRPFATPQGPAREVLDEMIRDRRRVPSILTTNNQAVTPAVEAIISRCLQADPALRYQSARQLQEDLHRHLTDEPLLHVTESLHERCLKWFRRNRKNVVRSAAVAAGVAVFALGGLLVHIEQDRVRTKKRNLLVEAANKQTEFASITRQKTTPSIVLSRINDPKVLDNARRQAEEAVEQYSVLSDANWKSAVAVSNLDSAARSELLGDLGLTLVLLAQIELNQARLGKPTERQLEAIRLRLDRAEGCYENTTLPRVLWEMRSEVAALAGDKSEAGRCTEMAAKSPLESVSDRRLTATYVMSLGNVPLAVHYLKQLAEQDAGSVMVWSNLGDGYYRLGRYADAITCYTVCAALAPDVNRYRVSRGYAYTSLGDASSAQADFSHVLDRDPQNVDALVNRSVARRNLHDYSGAIADLTLAATFPDASPARIHFQAAEVLRQKGDLVGADREKALGMKAECTIDLDWIARGNCELGNKDPEAALRSFTEASKLSPESVVALYNQAISLAKIKGRTEDAVKVLDKTLGLFPEHVDARALRGLYLARLGKRDLAVKDAEYVLKRDNRATTRYLVADIYALCSRSQPNDAVAAIANLAAAFRGGNTLDDVKIDTDLDSIRSNPEFQKLCSSAQQVRNASKPAGLR